VEQRELVRRAQEAAREEIEKFYASQPVITHIEKSVITDDFKRRDREAKERASEAQMLNSLSQAEKHRELSLMRAEEEDKIATALARRALEKERKEKEILLLREQSQELRDLAEKIRMAKVARERALQVQEKAQIKAQQLEYDTKFNAYVDEVDAAAQARQADFEARKKEQNVNARLVLEEQIRERQDALRLAEDGYQRERAMVDEVVRRIQEEDMAEAALRHQRQEETKQYIANFLAEKEIEKMRKIEATQAEEKKIQDYWDMVRDREAAEAGRQADRKEAADRMYEKVKKEMEDEMRRREEEDYLINLLRQEELEAKRQAEDEAKIRKAEEMKAEMIRANEQQKRMREAREAARVAEEEDLRQRLMAKFAEDDRIEQMNAQKRRMKLLDHQRAVAAMIEDKRRMYMEQKAREEADIAAVRAEDERKLAIVEAERKRLLAEAAELRDYLPRGVIRDQGDLEFVNKVLAGQHL